MKNLQFLRQIVILNLFLKSRKNAKDAATRKPTGGASKLVLRTNRKQDSIDAQNANRHGENTVKILTLLHLDLSGYSKKDILNSFLLSTYNASK